MVTTVTQDKTILPNGKADPVPSIPWEDFEKEYLVREDLARYEWVGGVVTQTAKQMNQYQYFILDNILEYFIQLRMEGKVTGKLYTEIDTFFLKDHHRRPDMAWFSNEQAARMAYRENQVPSFVLEIILDNDNADNLLDKLSDYAEAKVQVIWLISPKLEQVHIYNAQGKSISKGDMLCSASPVLPGFEITANNLFKKPKWPGE
jgi:Uma2 family endonuclease